LYLPFVVEGLAAAPFQSTFPQAPNPHAGVPSQFVNSGFNASSAGLGMNQSANFQMNQMNMFGQNVNRFGKLVILL